MSYITEVKLEITLNKEKSIELYKWIERFIDSRNVIPFSDHPFFKTKRWMMIFSTMGYDNYTKPSIKEFENKYVLNLHCDINYEDEEVKMFAEFIKEYSLGRKKKKYIGYMKPEGINERINVYI